MDREAVGKKLRELRGIRTRTGVARELKISPSSMAAYEYGYRMPRDKVKAKLADYYGKTVDEIFHQQENG